MKYVFYPFATALQIRYACPHFGFWIVHMNTLPLNAYDNDVPLEYVQHSIAQHGLPDELLSSWLGIYERSPTQLSPLQTKVFQALQKCPEIPTLAHILFAPLIYKTAPKFDMAHSPSWPMVCEIFNNTIPYRPAHHHSDPHRPNDIQFKMLLTLLSSPLSPTFKTQLKQDVFKTWSEPRYQQFLLTVEGWLQNLQPLDANVFSTLLENLREIDVSPSFLCSVALFVSDTPHLLDQLVTNCGKYIFPYLKENWKILIVPHLLSDKKSKSRIWDVLSFVETLVPQKKLEPFVEERFIAQCVNEMKGFTEESVAEYSRSHSGKNMARLYLKLAPSTVLSFVVKKMDQFEDYPPEYIKRFAQSLENLLSLGLNIDAVLLNEKRLPWDHETPLALARCQSLALNAAVSKVKGTSKRRKKI